MAERVGFVPGVPAPINGLGQIRTARSRQIHSTPEYQVQSRDSVTFCSERSRALAAYSPAVRRLGAKDGG